MYPPSFIMIQQKVEQYIKQVFKTTTVQKYREDGKLHFSSFPFCPLKRLYSYMYSGIVQEHNMDFSMRYYTSVGTTVHSVMQEYAGIRGKVLGDYVCKNPECDAVGVVNEFTTNPICPYCGQQCQYEELSVTYGKNTIGHSDGVYEYTQGRYVVIDYKTSSVANINKHKEKQNVFPYLSNEAQIKMYCVAIEEERSIPIDGYALIYLARDNPMVNHVVYAKSLSEKSKSVLKKRIHRYDRQWGVMLNVTSYKDEHFAKLVETKPCRDYAHYKEKMFDGYNHCPLCDVCFDDKALVKEFKVAFVNRSVTLPLKEEFKRLLG